MTRSKVCTKISSNGGQTSYVVKSMGINVIQIFGEGRKIGKVSPEYIIGGYSGILCEAKSQCLQEDPFVFFILPIEMACFFLLKMFR